MSSSTETAIDDGPSEKPSRPEMVVRSVPAVTRAAAILRLLARSDTPLGVNAIARPLGIVPSTCLHILRALAAEDLVAYDPATKRYGLASGIVALARGMLRHDVFSNIVQPILDELSERFGVTAMGTSVTGLDRLVVVAVSRPGLTLRLRADVGSRYPALISATGRCIAAFGGHPRKELEKRFAALRWDDPIAFADWLVEVDKARADGFAADEGRYIRGVTIVAAPVMPRGRVSHTVVILGVSQQLERIGLPTLGRELKDRADALSRRLETT
jgi:DNA-binding IclR family transcriptional regulator